MSNGSQDETVSQVDRVPVGSGMSPVREAVREAHAFAAVGGRHRRPNVPSLPLSRLREGDAGKVLDMLEMPAVSRDQRPMKCQRHRRNPEVVLADDPVHIPVL